MQSISLRCGIFNRALIALCSYAAVAAATAGGLQIAPVSLQIPNNASAEAIWLSNPGDAPMHAQVRVFQWTQQDGEDMLAPSTQLTISPPLVEIAPGARQLLRVIRSSAAPAAGVELTYRLIIDELPIAVAVDSATSAAENARKRSAGINFVMRYSVPVFVGDPAAQAIGQSLDWSLHKAVHVWSLRVHNRGSMRAQVAEIRALTADKDSTLLRSGLVGYVLPGSTMEWKFPAPKDPERVQGYQAMINEDVQSLHVTDAP